MCGCTKMIVMKAKVICSPPTPLITKTLPPLPMPQGSIVKDKKLSVYDGLTKSCNNLKVDLMFPDDYNKGCIQMKCLKRVCCLDAKTTNRLYCNHYDEAVGKNK
jgi:hypothetical protein